MMTREEYHGYFLYHNTLVKNHKRLTDFEMTALGVNTFDAVMVKKLFTTDELKRNYPYILGHIERLYKEYDWE